MASTVLFCFCFFPLNWGLNSCFCSELHLQSLFKFETGSTDLLFPINLELTILLSQPPTMLGLQAYATICSLHFFKKYEIQDVML